MPWAAPAPGRPEVPSLITPRSHRPARGTRRPAAGQRIDAHRHDEHRIVHAGPGGVAVTALPGFAPGTRAIRIARPALRTPIVPTAAASGGTSPRSGSRCGGSCLPTPGRALVHADSAETRAAATGTAERAPSPFFRRACDRTCGTPDHRTRTVHHPVLTVE